MKTFETIAGISSSNDIIMVTTEEGNRYSHTQETYLENLQVGDWIVCADWEKMN